MDVIARRCEEADRDPRSLRVSVHVFWTDSAEAGPKRIELLAAYRDAGVFRVQTLIRDCVRSDDAVASFADDARAAGVVLHTANSAAPAC